MKFPQLFVVMTAFFLPLSATTAATKTSTGSGNWNTAATWSPSGVPATSDDVIIASGHTVVVDVNTASVGTLTIQAGATLRGDGTNKVLSIGRDASQDFFNSGTLDFGPPYQATIRLRRSSQWGGTTGEYKLSTLDLNGKTLSFVTGSTIQVQFTAPGNSISNAGTINGISTVVFNYNGTSSQALSSSANVNYGTLWINNAAGVTLSRSLVADDMRGHLRVQTGTLSTGGYSITGTSGMTFEVADGATFNLTSASAMPTGFSTKTFGASSNVEYSGATPQKVSAETYGNLTLSNGGTKTMSGAMTIQGNLTISGAVVAAPSGALTVNGNFSIGSLASFNAGAFTHSIKGNWANSGTFNTSTSTINLNGTTTQSVSATTFNNLTINNAAGALLTGSVTLPGTLTLTSGIVSTGANVLTLGTSTGTLGTLVRTAGWVNGNFRRWFATATVSNVLLPVGDSVNYRPAVLSFTAFPSSGGTLTALFTNSDPGINGLPILDGATSIQNCGIDGFWTLTAGSGLTGGTYSLDLTATGFCCINDVTTLRIVKRTSSGSAWTLNGTHAIGTGTIAVPVVHRTGMSGFSQFGIGGGSDNPLPIQLSYFSGAVISSQNNVRLTWGTVSETNNFGFTIQQRIGEEGEFSDLENSFVAGHGTTIEPQEYEWIHESVPAGSYYYRLKQTDLDGAIHFTDAISIVVDPLASVIEEAPRVFALSQNYPNPFNPSTTVRFTVKNNGIVTIAIYNLLGQQVAIAFAGEVSAGRYYDVTINASDLTSGSYFYKLSNSDGQSFVRRMVVLK